MSFDENIAYSELAKKLRIDVLESGFPASGAVDFNIVLEIARRCRAEHDVLAQEQLAASSESDGDVVSLGARHEHDGMIVAGLCQLREPQVLKTMEALAPLQNVVRAGDGLRRGRVHMYAPVGPLADYSLGKKDPKTGRAKPVTQEEKEKTVKEVYRLVKLVVDSGFDVEFSAENYSGMGDKDFPYVTELFTAAAKSGARVINCPDTRGAACAHADGELFFVNDIIKHKALVESRLAQADCLGGIEGPLRAAEIIWSTHNHNDLGLAVENSIHAVVSGPCRQVEGCLNGVGERAGNAAIENVAMLIETVRKSRSEGGGAGGRNSYVVVTRLLCVFLEKWDDSH